MKSAMKSDGTRDQAPQRLADMMPRIDVESETLCAVVPVGTAQPLP